MEECDVYNEFGVQTGRKVKRGTTLAPSEYYLVVHVWIRDENGNYLIQQRALHLASDPGRWAATVGYAQSGEDSISAAVREVKEELGIQLSPAILKKLDRIQLGNRIEDIWLAEVSSISIGALAIGPEVADWMWVSRSGLEQRVNRGDFFAYSYLGDLPG